MLQFGFFATVLAPFVAYGCIVWFYPDLGRKS